MLLDFDFHRLRPPLHWQKDLQRFASEKRGSGIEARPHYSAVALTMLAGRNVCLESSRYDEHGLLRCTHQLKTCARVLGTVCPHVRIVRVACDLSKRSILSDRVLHVSASVLRRPSPRHYCPSMPTLGCTSRRELPCCGTRSMVREISVPIGSVVRFSPLGVFAVVRVAFSAPSAVIGFPSCTSRRR